jgi:hypothetical protein
LALQVTDYDSIFLEEPAAPFITKSISFLVLSKLFIPESQEDCGFVKREPFA